MNAKKLKIYRRFLSLMIAIVIIIPNTIMSHASASQEENVIAQTQNDADLGDISDIEAEDGSLSDSSDESSEDYSDDNGDQDSNDNNENSVADNDEDNSDNDSENNSSDVSEDNSNDENLTVDDLEKYEQELYGDDENGGAVDGRDLTLSWLTTYHTGSAAAGSVTGDSLEVTPSSNTTQTIYAHLEYVYGGDSDAEPGDITIYLPYSVLDDRYGDFAETTRGSGIGTESDQGESGFYYAYVDMDDDGNLDTIVIKNWKTISPGNKFSMDFSYSYLPSTIENGSTFTLEATANIIDRSGNDITESTLTSNELDVIINTDVTSGSHAYTTRTTNFTNGYYSEWQSGWGDTAKSLLTTGDDKDYYYVYYQINYYDTATNTQPYTITLADSQTELDAEAQGGIFLGFTGYYRSLYAATYSTTYGSYVSAYRTKVLTPCDLSIDISPPLTSRYYYYTYAIVAYPKTLWTDLALDGTDTLSFSNTVEATVVDVDDGEVDTKSSKGTYKYTLTEYTSMPTTPYSDYLSTLKGVNATLSSPTQQYNSTWQYGQ